MTEDDKTIIKSIAYQAIGDSDLVENDMCQLRHEEVKEVKKRINWVLVTLVVFALTLASNFIMQYNRATIQAKQITHTEIQDLTESVKALVDEIK